MSIIRPREEVWPGQTPTTSTGTVRPIITPAPGVIVHWTGKGFWTDHDDTPLELRQIQAWAASVGKPWEYNYVGDSQGLVFEYAGEHRAAHSEGENSWLGYLLLYGPGESLPNPMVESFRRWRKEMVDTGKLVADHQVIQHGQAPGANTACPGGPAIGRWGELTRPWEDFSKCPPPPPDPAPIFAPEYGLWGLWPLSTVKPPLARWQVDMPDEREATRYLQGVILHKAGGRIAVDGVYGWQTERRVRDVQTLFKLPVDGRVGKQTWGVIDWLAGR